MGRIRQLNTKKTQALVMSSKEEIDPFQQGGKVGMPRPTSPHFLPSSLTVVMLVSLMISPSVDAWTASPLFLESSKISPRRRSMATGKVRGYYHPQSSPLLAVSSSDLGAEAMRKRKKRKTSSKKEQTAKRNTKESSKKSSTKSKSMTSKKYPESSVVARLAKASSRASEKAAQQMTSPTIPTTSTPFSSTKNLQPPIAKLTQLTKAIDQRLTGKKARIPSGRTVARDSMAAVVNYNFQQETVGQHLDKFTAVRSLETKPARIRAGI